MMTGVCKSRLSGFNLKEAVFALGWMDEAAFDRAVDLGRMCFPHDTPNE